MQRFVILATQRTGSNLLRQMLDSHPDVICHGELLRKNNVRMKGALRVIKKIDVKFMDEDYRHSHPGEMIEQIFNLSKDSAKSVGFKLMLGQNPTYRDQLLSDPRFYKILLSRHNLLAAYSSEKIAKITGQGIVGRASEVKKAKTDFNVKEFERFMSKRIEEYEAVRSSIHRHAQPILDLEYLSLFHGNGVDACLRFLGHNRGQAKQEPNTKKRNPSDIILRFNNAKSVEKYLKDNGLEHWRTELPE